MNFSISRDAFLKPLQVVSGAVERRHTIPILSNVLIQVTPEMVRMTGTDLEVELVSACAIENGVEGKVTVPAKKLVDIVRSLPDGDRKSTRLNSSHVRISYAVFCLKKKK